MKRDMGLVRQVLLEMEACPSGFYMNRTLTIEGHDARTIGYHVHIMEQAELIEATSVTSYGDDTPQSVPLTITWKGHEFIDASREPVVWERALAILHKAGSSSFPVLMEALTKAALERFL